MATDETFTPDENVDPNDKYDPDAKVEPKSDKKKTTFAEKIRNLNTRLQRKVDVKEVFTGGQPVDESTKTGKFIKGATETGRAASDLLGTLMGNKKPQSEEDRYGNLVKQAEPYIKESIDYEVSKVAVPKRKSYKSDEAYAKAMAQYEGNVRELRDRKTREFEMRSPVSKAQFAVDKLKAAKSKRVEVENYIRSQEINNTGDNPVSRFLVNSKNQEDYQNMYQQKSQAPLNVLARGINEAGQKQQKPVPTSQYPSNLGAQASPFMGGNPIAQPQYNNQPPMRRPMKNYNAPQAYSQPFRAQPMPIQSQGMGMQPPQQGPQQNFGMGMQAPQQVQDIPNHRMMPPAYSAAHPWLAPNEYPPFGDNPSRNFAEKNLDHPLFQTNKPKGRNLMTDSQPNQPFQW
jgi:hypothetical protein